MVRAGAHDGTPVRHAAVIRFGSLGDIVLATPVLGALKQRIPGVRITFVTKRKYASLLEGHPDVDRLVLLDGSGIAALVRLAARLRNTAFDLVADLHAVPRSYLLCLLLNKRKTVRYDKERQLRTLLVRQGHRTGRSLPVTEKYLMCLPGTEPVKLTLPVLYPTEAHHASVRNLLGKGGDGRPLVAIHPGAAWPEKRWPADRFLKLMEQKKASWRFVLVGGTDDVLPSNIDGTIDATGRTSPGELAALLAQCRVLVCGDTGPMHVAGAVGCGVVALFGPTHPVLGFAPQHAGTRILCRNEPCSPCSLHGSKPCRFGDRHCLTDISIAEVIREVDGILSESKEV